MQFSNNPRKNIIIEETGNALSIPGTGWLSQVARTDGAVTGLQTSI
jgi:hypothetical protein